MTTNYRTQLLQELRQSIAELPGPAERLACSLRCEKLRDELHDEMTYAPRDLVAAVQPQTAVATSETPIKGRDAKRDLLLLIEDLAPETIVEAEDAPETVLTMDELAERWNVSAKTVSRWRNRGLVARTFIFDGRSRVGFLQSSVERFAREHPQLVRRGSLFSRLSDEEREHILRRGQELLDGLAAPKDVLPELASETQRSVETIRQLLDRAGLLSRERRGQLSEDAKQRLFKRYQRGQSVASLAQHFNLPESQVRRTIDHLRAERIQELPLDYMFSPEFTNRRAEQEILAPMPESSTPTRTPRKPSDLPAYIASLYDVPLLTSEQETHLFRMYNYLKYKASELRDTLSVKQPSGRTLDQIERLYEQALATNNQLVRANLRLVVSVAKKYVGATGDLFEKVSEGNESLMRAVEKFDYTRGFKFSTYATWAIKKNFIRSYATAIKQADRFRTGHEELLDSRIAYRANPHVELDAQRQREQQVASVMRELSDRERDIIRSRFGMGPGAEPKTLQEVGDEMGVSKERVRQLESRAIEKLRGAFIRARGHDGLHEEHFSYESN